MTQPSFSTVSHVDKLSRLHDLTLLKDKGHVKVVMKPHDQSHFGDIGHVIVSG